MKNKKEETKIRIVIIGVRHLHPDSYMQLFRQIEAVEVIGVIEKVPEHRKAFSLKHGIPGYADLQELPENQCPDVAAIFLPHDECGMTAKRCAQAGMHLLIEKPFASTSQMAREIKQVAEMHDVHVSTGYCWRFHPAVKILAELLQNGTIGQVINVEGRCAAGRLSRYIEGNSEWILDKERSGGGPLYNLGVHWIDLFRYLLGSEVTEVSGEITNVTMKYNIEDGCFAHLRFANQALATLNVSYTVPESFPHGRDLYIAIYGENGTVRWSPAYEGEIDRIEIFSDSETSAGAANRCIELELDKVEGYSGFMGMAYLKDFIAAVRGERTTPLIGANDAIAALEVAEGIYLSAQEKCWIPVANTPPAKVQ